MIHPALDRAVFRCALAQIAQFMGTHDPKTDQTAQSDQRIEMAERFGAPPGQELTSAYQKLTSGTARQPCSIVQVVGASLESARASPSDGAPQL